MLFSGGNDRFLDSFYCPVIEIVLDAPRLEKVSLNKKVYLILFWMSSLEKCPMKFQENNINDSAHF